METSKNSASRASVHLFIQREEPLQYFDWFVENTWRVVVLGWSQCTILSAGVSAQYFESLCTILGELVHNTSIGDAQ